MARGQYVPKPPVLIPSIDGAILGTLPKEGSKIGVKPMARQCRAIARDLAEQGLTSAEIHGRLRALKHEEYGYVVALDVLPLSNGQGYQITPAGEKYLAGLKED